MTESVLGTSPSTRRWTLLLSILLPVLALLVVGQDRNWDLLNYHLYDPFAWLHGRLQLDIAPAQMQSWYNPLLDVPLYLMTSAGWPGFVVSLWLTLPMILALYFLLRIYPLLSANAVTRTGLAMLAMLAMTGAAALAEVGACFNDAFVAASVSGSLYLLLRGDPDTHRSRAWCVAGLLLGAVTGLKLTAAVYCIGLAGAAIAMPSWRRIPHRLIALLIGGIVGFALTYGYWGTMLFHQHGNPFFPYYNQIFHSPDARLSPYTDERFKPQTWIDALLIPIRLLTNSRRYSEIAFRDPRLLLGMIGYVLLLWRSHRGDASPGEMRVARLRALAGFFFVSFFVWAFQYGIYRYVLPLELLACMVLMLLLEWLPPRHRLVGAMLACLLVIAAGHHPSWGRSRFQATFVEVQMPALPRGSMVVLSGQSPLAYAVTALPDDVAAIAIDNNFMHADRCMRLTAVAARRIAAHVGPLWLLRGETSEDDAGQRKAEDAYGLVVSGPCQMVETNLGTLRLCPLRRDPPPPLCATASPIPGR